MSKTYWEKLKDPRWQACRLRVFEHAQFTCSDCGDTDKTLHVHHTIYRKGCEPWEHAIGTDLVCVCETCHEYRTVQDQEIKESLTDSRFRELVLLLSRSRNPDPTEWTFAGRFTFLCGGLSYLLDRIAGVTASLSGSLSGTRKESQLKCIGYRNDALNSFVSDLTDALAQYHRDTLERHERECGNV
jgi:hypothetical protein